MAQAGAVELVEDELLDGFRPQARQQRRVGDPGADLLVDREGQGLHQRRLADEHEVVGARKVLTHQPQFAEAIGRHQVSVIDDRHEHFAGAINAESFLNQQPSQ